MKWETAKKYLHPLDVKNIKLIARKYDFKLSGRTIDYIFDRVHESGEYTFEEIHSMERRLKASIGY